MRLQRFIFEMASYITFLVKIRYVYSAYIYKSTKKKKLMHIIIFPFPLNHLSHIIHLRKTFGETHNRRMFSRDLVLIAFAAAPSFVHFPSAVATTIITIRAHNQTFLRPIKNLKKN